MEVLKATLRTRIGKKIEQETENAHFHAFLPRENKLLKNLGFDHRNSEEKIT